MKQTLPLLIAAAALLSVSCGNVTDKVTATVSRNTAYTGRGNCNEELLSISISPEKGCRLGTVTVDLDCSADNVDALRITSGDNVIGETKATGSCGTYAIDCGRKISGDTDIRLVADVKEEAPEGSTISADIASISFRGIEITPEKAESGCREVLLRSKCLYKPGEGGSKYWRIPALLQLSDGTLLAVNDKRNFSEEDLPNEIDVVYRYSTDSGKTWSDMGYIAKNGGHMEGYGDPGLAELEDGTVICTFTSGERFVRSRWDNPQRSFYSISKDHGRSWSEPVEITGTIWGPEPYNPQCKKYHSAFTSSGNSLVIRNGEHKGRMIAASVISFGEGWNDLCDHAIFTDDGGKTWGVSDLAYGPAENETKRSTGDEAKMVELLNGDILMSVRNPGTRKWAISHDGGETWPERGEWDNVSACACNGDLIRYNEGILLHSVPDCGNRRSDVSVLLSFDEGKTWTKRKVICKGPSQYSSLTVLKDGTIGAFVEKNGSGVELWFLNFSIDWLQNQ